MAAKTVGKVISLFPHRGYGWIQLASGEELFFHKRAVMTGGKFPAVNDWVAFVHGTFQGKGCAVAVEVISEPQPRSYECSSERPSGQSDGRPYGQGERS